MRLTTAAFDHLPEPRLDDGDPLPPDDRAAAPENGPEVLYHAHAGRLLRFFSRRAGPTDAPDLVQETLVRMAGTEPAARRLIESPGAFLTRIAARTSSRTGRNRPPGAPPPATSNMTSASTARSTPTGFSMIATRSPGSRRPSRA